MDIVRRLTVSSLEPAYSIVPPGCLFENFTALNIDDVINTIMRFPDKQSFCDVLPIPVLKQIAADVAPFLAALYNCSLSNGVFPECYKTAYITPLIKKSGLDFT